MKPTNFYKKKVTNKLFRKKKSYLRFAQFKIGSKF